MTVVPEARNKNRSSVIMIAGFGDDGSMYDALKDTDLSRSHNLIPLNMPGFGAPARNGDTTLLTLATFVNNAAKQSGARTVVAHSVASIIASLAATGPGSTIKNIISLEGNLTPEDAYFSGSAADYDSPKSFHAAFLMRLKNMAAGDGILQRYYETVNKADPLALWQLGVDAKRFSVSNHPGEVLASSADVTYIYNPENCPESSIKWLENSSLNSHVLHEASHWPSVDKPVQLAEIISLALSQT